MIGFFTESIPTLREEDLRHRIDRSVSRALTDKKYAAELLLEPTIVLDGGGCSPQHYMLLLDIRATSLRDFASQVQALFWTVEARLRPFDQEDPLPMAAGAH